MYQFINENSIFQYFGEDDPKMIREMVQIILDTNVKDLKQLDQLYETQDFVVLKKRCHRAKPSMSYIGARKTRKILAAMEANPSQSQELNKTLQFHLLQIESELNQFLKSIN